MLPQASILIRSLLLADSIVYNWKLRLQFETPGLQSTGSVEYTLIYISFKSPSNNCITPFDVDPLLN